MKSKKSFISIILTLVMLLGLVPISNVTASAADTCTVTYDMQGVGEQIAPQKYPKGGSWIETKPEEVEGYRFVCWTTSPVSGKDEDFDVYGFLINEWKGGTIDKSITLYAHWQKYIEEINLEIKNPIAGTMVTDLDSPDDNDNLSSYYPEITILDENPHYSIYEGSDGYGQSWPGWLNEDRQTFNNFIEYGETYYADFIINLDFGYTINNANLTLYVNGKDYTDVWKFSERHFAVPLTALNEGETEPQPTEEVTEAPTEVVTESVQENAENASQAVTAQAEQDSNSPIIIILIIALAAVVIAVAVLAVIIIKNRKK